MAKCNVCGESFLSSTKVVEHIRRKHSKLSKESIQYLRDLGVSEDRITELLRHELKPKR